MGHRQRDLVAYGMPSLVERVKAWQAGGSPVTYAGIPVDDWSQNTDLNGIGWTIIDRAQAFNQDGVITEASVYVSVLGTGAWKIKVVRPDGAGLFDPVGEFEFTPSGTGVQVVSGMSIAVKSGDIAGIFFPSGAKGRTNTTVQPYFSTTRANGDITTSNAFSTNADEYRMLIDFRGHRPYLAMLGDSIARSVGWAGYYQTPASGNYGRPGGNKTRRVDEEVFKLVPNMTGQNFGQGNGTFNNVRVTQMPDAVARNAHTFIVGPVGYNDVDTGRSWASIEADLDNILLQLTDSEQRLACLEILPGRFGTSDAAKKATRNTYNDNYKSWASGKSNVVFIECYDLMSDGSDELQASYHNGDHIHLSPAGAKALAPIVEAAL